MNCNVRVEANVRQGKGAEGEVGSATLGRNNHLQCQTKKPRYQDEEEEEEAETVI